MVSLNRRLLRIAGKLEAAYGAVRSRRREPKLPKNSWLEAKRVLRRFNLAQGRGWSVAAAREQQALATELEYLSHQLQDEARKLQAEDPRPVPALRMLYDELLAADAEFGGLDRDNNELVVTTEPIELEGIELGPFQIRLDFSRLGTKAPFLVVALEPNTSATCSSTTHPHVNCDQLCAGEGEHAISAALQEGRLYDFFTIVDRVLHTYAEGSAFVEMRNWSGAVCHACDDSFDADDASTCSGCEATLCSDCIVCCDGCSGGFCSECIELCARCSDRYCGDCLLQCSHCDQDVCDACSEGTICTQCLEEIENNAKETSETAPAAATIVPAKSAV